MIPLLRFPPEWGGSISCAPQTFGAGSPAASGATQDGGGVAAEGGSGPRQCDDCGGPSDPRDGSCLRNCQGNWGGRLGLDPAQSLFSNFRRDLNGPCEDPPWADILQPYFDVCASNSQAAQVLRDCTRKLNGLDPERGIGVLHGLLLVGDDVDLFKRFLELGVDPEITYLSFGTPREAKGKNDGRQRTASPSRDAVDNQLDGGTALHFASFYARKQCLLALLDAGVNPNAKTKAGKTASDLAKDPSIKTQLATFLEADDPKSIAQLAKENKYFAIRHKMRAGKISNPDLKTKFESKTAADWIWTFMCAWDFSMKTDGDSFAPFKLMSEMNYRYGVDIKSQDGPPDLGCVGNRQAPASTAASIGINDGATDELLLGTVQTVLNNQAVLMGSLKEISADVQGLRHLVETHLFPRGCNERRSC